MWRPEGDKPLIEIHRARGSADPTSLEYQVDHGAAEVIPEVSTVFDLDRSPVVTVDLDPKMDCTDDFLVQTTGVILQLLGQNGRLAANYKIMGVKVRFTGNRSMHVIVGFAKPQKLDEVREAVRDALKTICGPKSMFSTEPEVGDRKFFYLDIGVIAKHKCVRSLYSLHAKTGLVCVPVPDILSFRREHAEPKYVLKTGPIEELF